MWPKIINLHKSFQISSTISVHTYIQIIVLQFATKQHPNPCVFHKVVQRKWGGGVTFFNSWHWTIRWWVKIWIICYFILQLQIYIFHLLRTFCLKNLATFYGELFQNVGIHFSLQFQSQQTGTVSFNIWELGYKSLYSDWAAGWIQRTISGRGKGFFSSSENPQLYRGPLSLPFNDYWKFFPWRQSKSGVKLTTHFHLEPRLIKNGDRVFTLIIKPNRCTNFSQIYYWNNTLHVSNGSSGHRQEFFTVHKAIIYVVCQTPDDGQRNRPKHVEFYSNNKFEKN